jgi:tetratricopeptide (TPR) repeat protein
MRCHYHRKEYLESLAAGHACLDINRVYNDFYEYIAWSFDALGYRDEAIAAFQKAIRYVEPWNPNAKVKYERYLADLLDEGQKKENADGES